MSDITKVPISKTTKILAVLFLVAVLGGGVALGYKLGKGKEEEKEEEEAAEKKKGIDNPNLETESLEEKTKELSAESEVKTKDKPLEK